MKRALGTKITMAIIECFNCLVKYKRNLDACPNCKQYNKDKTRHMSLGRSVGRPKNK